MNTAFEVNIIASGSRGNATLLKVGNTAVLIDAGVSCKRLTEGIRSCGLEPEDLNGVLLTHEHSDHVGGLSVFGRRYAQVPIYANEKTWMALPCRREFLPTQIRVLPRGCTLGNLRVESFKIPHDAADPVGYKLYYGDDKCTYLTDCGYITKTCEEAVEGSSTLILEANHDENMLKHGPYPLALQKRILGNYGHLSNFTAGKFLRSLKQMPQEVFLAHLSQENNTASLAAATVEDVLTEENKFSLLQLYIARQNVLVSNKN